MLKTQILFQLSWILSVFLIKNLLTGVLYLVGIIVFANVVVVVVAAAAVAALLLLFGFPSVDATIPLSRASSCHN